MLRDGRWFVDTCPSCGNPEHIVVDDRLLWCSECGGTYPTRDPDQLPRWGAVLAWLIIIGAFATIVQAAVRGWPL